MQNRKQSKNVTTVCIFCAQSLYNKCFKLHVTHDFCMRLRLMQLSKIYGMFRYKPRLLRFISSRYFLRNADNVASEL